MPTLSVLDKLLPLWIFLAMALGVLLGYSVAGLSVFLDAVQVGGVSVPIGAGLLWMMYPVFAKVRYEELPALVRKSGAWKQFLFSAIVNWLVGPLVMTLLAHLCLPDLPDYRQGLVLVGVARCIAMVLVWNMLAGGDEEYCALLVGLNSLFQIAFFAPLAVFYIETLSAWIDAGEAAALRVSFLQVFVNVVIFLGIPMVAGMLTRVALRRIKGVEWYNDRFLPRIGPTALLGLLFTIVMMFALQAHQLLNNLVAVLRVSVPLVLYFGIMFVGTFALSKALRFSYKLSATQAFTAAGNNFELAIAIAVGTYGIASAQALATTVGPLIEVPALLGLVYLARLFRERLYARELPDHVTLAEEGGDEEPQRQKGKASRTEGSDEECQREAKPNENNGPSAPVVAPP